jgi:hypothetical protein
MRATVYIGPEVAVSDEEMIEAGVDAYAGLGVLATVTIKRRPKFAGRQLVCLSDS